MRGRRKSLSNAGEPSINNNNIMNKLSQKRSRRRASLSNADAGLESTGIDFPEDEGLEEMEEFVANMKGLGSSDDEIARLCVTASAKKMSYSTIYERHRQMKENSQSMGSRGRRKSISNSGTSSTSQTAAKSLTILFGNSAGDGKSSKRGLRRSLSGVALSSCTKGIRRSLSNIDLSRMSISRSQSSLTRSRSAGSKHNNDAADNAISSNVRRRRRASLSNCGSENSNVNGGCRRRRRRASICGGSEDNSRIHRRASLDSTATMEVESEDFNDWLDEMEQFVASIKKKGFTPDEISRMCVKMHENKTEGIAQRRKSFG